MLERLDIGPNFTWLINTPVRRGGLLFNLVAKVVHKSKARRPLRGGDITNKFIRVRYSLGIDYDLLVTRNENNSLFCYSVLLHYCNLHSFFYYSQDILIGQNRVKINN